MSPNRKEAIVVIGVPGAGKSLFSNLFQNSFLKGYPIYKDTDNVPDHSISFISELKEEDFHFFSKLNDEGFVFTYYVFLTPPLLAKERLYIEQLKGEEKIIPSDDDFKRFGDKLLNLYLSPGVTFFLTNYGELSFKGSCNTGSLAKIQYKNLLQQLIKRYC